MIEKQFIWWICVVLVVVLDMVLPHRLYFKELCDNYSNEYFMNEKYKEKVSELIKEIKTLKQENEKHP